jgi:hypothetical protein
MMKALASFWSWLTGKPPKKTTIPPPSPAILTESGTEILAENGNAIDMET